MGFRFDPIGSSLSTCEILRNLSWKRAERIFRIDFSLPFDFLNGFRVCHAQGLAGPPGPRLISTVRREPSSMPFAGGDQTFSRF